MLLVLLLRFRVMTIKLKRYYYFNCCLSCDMPMISERPGPLEPDSKLRGIEVRLLPFVSRYIPKCDTVCDTIQLTSACHVTTITHAMFALTLQRPLSKDAMRLVLFRCSCIQRSMQHMFNIFPRYKRTEICRTNRRCSSANDKKLAEKVRNPSHSIHISHLSRILEGRLNFGLIR